MNFGRTLKTIERKITDNSPVILTAVGVTGTITTAYLASTASIKAYKLLDDENPHRTVKLTLKDKARRTWKLYIPAVATGVLTCGAIVMANRIGTRRAAAMAAAFTISEKAFEEYKDKVVEQIGKNKEQKVRDDIAQDRVNENPPTQIHVTGGGDILCMDAHSGRYFQSSMETLKKAQNDTNYELLNHGYASLSDFYNRVGLANTKISDDIGWNSDNLLELSFTTTMSDDDRPCIVVDFAVVPMRNYFRVH